MDMFYPVLTHQFLCLGYIVFFLMFAYFLKLVFSKYFRARMSKPAIILVASTILTNSLLFTLFAGMDAHIRYALPSYVIIWNFVSVFVFYEMLASKE